jgi:hypothetical protein
MIDNRFSYYNNRLLSEENQITYSFLNENRIIFDYSFNVEQWATLDSNYYTYSKYQTFNIKYQYNLSHGQIELQFPFEYYSYKSGRTSLDSSIVIGFTPKTNSDFVTFTGYVEGGNIDEIDELINDSKEISLSSYLTFSIVDNFSINPFIKFCNRKNNLAEYSYNYLNLYIDLQYDYNAFDGLSSILSFSQEDSWYKNNSEIKESKVNLSITYSI